MNLKIQKKSFTVNGKPVADFSNLPPAAQKVLEDADGNGVPDILEGLDDSGVHTTITINGQTYSSWDEVPAEYQHLKPDIQSEVNTAQPTPVQASSDVHPAQTSLQNDFKSIVIAILVGLVVFLGYFVFFR